MSRRSLASLMALALLAACLAAGLWLSQRRSKESAVASAPGAPESIFGEPDADLETPLRDSETARSAVAPPPAPPRSSAVASQPTAETVPAGEARVEVLVLARETKTPLGGVRLEIHPAGESERGGMVIFDHEGGLGSCPDTDEEGRAAFRVPPGDYTVAVASWQDLYEKRSVDARGLVPDATRSVVLELQTRENALFYGQLLDDETGAPVDQATILVFDSAIGGSLAKPPEGLQLSRVPCGPSGDFTVPYRSRKPSAVRIDAPGFMRASCILVGGSTAESRFPVRLRRAARLAVTVLDGGQPAESLEVLARCPPEGLELSGEFSRFSRLEQGADGHFHNVDEIVRRAETDAAGGCLLEDLPPRAPISIEVLRGAELVYEMPGSRTLEPGAEDRLTIDLEAGCTLRGHAVDSAGQPMDGLGIWLVEASWTGGTSNFRSSMAELEKYIEARARTDAKGSFVFEIVPPGDWLVGPAAEESDPSSTVPDASRAAPVAQRVQISGEDRVREITLEVQRGLFIRGHVNVVPTLPDENIIFTAQARDLLFESYEVDPEGRFSIGPLAPGEYTVLASIGRREAIARARAGDEDVELRFDTRPTGSLRGRVDGFPGSTVKGSVTAWPAGKVDLEDVAGALESLEQDGSFECEDLAAGSYDVFVSTSDGLVAFTPNVVVAAGETNELVLELARGARLQVQARGAEFIGGLAVVRAGDIVVGIGGVVPETQATPEQPPLFVPAGTLQVELLWGAQFPPENRAGRTVTVAAGDEEEVIFDLDGR